jgi:glycosyltransferase involved in cell wall biosynthesis
LPHITIDARWINTSGIGTYLKNILPGIIQKNKDYEFLLLGNEARLIEISNKFGNVEIKNFDAPMYSLIEQFYYQKIIPGKTDLYFATHYNIPVLYRRRLLVTFYDLFHVANPNLVNSYVKSTYANYMFESVKNRANNIITISEFSKSEFIRLIGKPVCNIYAVPLGVETLKPNALELKAGLSNNEKPYILYVGNIKPHKNLKRLIQAFVAISHQIPHNLLLVGKKEGFLSGDGAISNLVSKYSNRIKLTGFVDDKELNQLYYKADVFVFPSLYEGFGFPPLEAMAHECATLVSTAASIPEVCGDASLYFNPKNTHEMSQKLYLILKDKKLRRSLQLKGLQRIKKFDWCNTIDQTSDILRSTLVK